MSLSKEQFEELVAALCAAFDHDSFEQMLQFKLGKQLYNIVPRDKSFETIVFGLVKIAEQEGWTESLIRGAYVSRPNAPKLKAFIEEHFPQAKIAQDSADQVAAVKVGLNALAKIVEQLADPAIRVIIGQFRADFDMTREKIATLGQYKGLHDQLHQLGAKYLRSMSSAVGLWRQDESQLQLLESYAEQLDGDAERIRPVAQKLKSYKTELDWIDSLELAADLVKQGLDKSDDVILQRGLLTLRRVLAEEPARINALVCSTAGDLRLEQIAEAMKRIDANLAARAGGAEEKLPLQDFAEGLSGMLLLKPRLSGLVEEHFEWQWLDKEFAAADALPGMTAEERFPRWTSFQTRLLGLCGLSAEKDWAKTLSQLVNELQALGVAHDAVQFGRRYNKFRTVAADRFFNVDAELLDLSDQLSEIADPIDQLLRIVTNGAQ